MRNLIIWKINFLFIIFVLFINYQIAFTNPLEIKTISFESKIHKIYQLDSNLWVGTDKGVYLIPTDLSQKPKLKIKNENRISPFYISNFIFYKFQNYLWIGTSNGLFRSEINTNNKVIPILADTGNIHSIFKTKSKLWIAASKGLYKWDKKLSEFPVKQINDIVNTYFFNRNRLYLGTTSGLKIIEINKDYLPRPISIYTGEVYNVFNVDNTLWICSQVGLFRLDYKLNSVPERIFLDTGYIFNHVLIGKNLIFGTENGLFLWKSDSTKEKPVAVKCQCGNVEKIISYHDKAYFVSTNSLYYWNIKKKNLPTLINWPAKNLYSIHIFDDSLFIQKENGLFHWKNDLSKEEFHPKLLIKGKIQLIETIEKDKTLWIVQNKTLYKIEANSIKKVFSPSSTITSIQQSPKYLWLGTTEQLIRITR